MYQSFIRYVKAGAVPVSDIEILERLSALIAQEHIGRPVELWLNPLISSPMLTGLLHPCIILPDMAVSEKNFRYIVLHELTHCKRRDIVYKWLVQFAVCLHWFNPLVHLMSREIEKACEFSCDEAVLAKTGSGNAKGYGETLLDAMASAGKRAGNSGAVTLSENRELLKARLKAIMNYRKKSKITAVLTGALTLGIISGTFLIGVYPVEAAPAFTEENVFATSGKNKETAPAQIVWKGCLLKAATTKKQHCQSLIRPESRRLLLRYRSITKPEAFLYLTLPFPGWRRSSRKNGLTKSIRMETSASFL